MPQIQIYDRQTPTNVRKTKEGFLVADVRVARTGVQEYAGTELGRPDIPVIRMYRPEAVVFAKDTMLTYAHRAVTNDHKGTVTPDNWRGMASGYTGDEVVRDGQFVRVPMCLMDGAAIADYERGKTQLSMGYMAAWELQDGVSPEGEAYNAIMTSQSMNHLALVDNARGGSQLRIGDSPAPAAVPSGQTSGGYQMPGELQKMVVDGLTIETTPNGAEAIAKLQGQLKDANGTITMMTADHGKALAERDAKITTLSGQVLDAAALDKLVTERADLLATATRIADGDYKGKTADEIRRTAVVAKLGDAAIAGKDAAYIAARFDILADDAKAAPEDTGGDPMRNAVVGDGKAAPVVKGNGQDAYHKRLQDGWK